MFWHFRDCCWSQMKESQLVFSVKLFCSVPGSSLVPVGATPTTRPTPIAPNRAAATGGKSTGSVRAHLVSCKIHSPGNFSGAKCSICARVYQTAFNLCLWLQPGGEERVTEASTEGVASSREFRRTAPTRQHTRGKSSRNNRENLSANRNLRFIFEHHKMTGVVESFAFDACIAIMLRKKSFGAPSPPPSPPLPSPQ